MRILLAGATGVIGRALLEPLRREGHHVTALVRGPESEVDADAVLVADLFDAESVRSAAAAAKPDAVVHQVTALRPASGETRWETMARNARVRVEGTANLIAAAREAGARRIVAQSIAFATAPVGPDVQDESAPLYLDAPDETWTTTVRAVAQLEKSVLGQDDIEGIVLRYGSLYGRDTLYDMSGTIGQAVHLRRLPLVGDGAGISSFVHVEDAALAAVAAVASSATGVFNIVDDDPAPASTWLPAFAELMGAPEPKQVPVDLGERLLGWFGAYQQTKQHGASNRKAADVLGWRPTVPSWRAGLAEAFR